MPSERRHICVLKTVNWHRRKLGGLVAILHQRKGSKNARSKCAKRWRNLALNAPFFRSSEIKSFLRSRRTEVLTSKTLLKCLLFDFHHFRKII